MPRLTTHRDGNLLHRGKRAQTHIHTSYDMIEHLLEIIHYDRSTVDRIHRSTDIGWLTVVPVVPLRCIIESTDTAVWLVVMPSVPFGLERLQNCNCWWAFHFLLGCKLQKFNSWWAFHSSFKSSKCQSYFVAALDYSCCFLIEVGGGYLCNGPYDVQVEYVIQT